MTSPHEIDAVFRGDRETVLRYELRHCTRNELEDLLVTLVATHQLFDDVAAKLTSTPRTAPSPPADDNSIANADQLVTQDERRLKDQHP